MAAVLSNRRAKRTATSLIQQLLIHLYIDRSRKLIQSRHRYNTVTVANTTCSSGRDIGIGSKRHWLHELGNQWPNFRAFLSSSSSSPLSPLEISCQQVGLARLKIMVLTCCSHCGPDPWYHHPHQACCCSHCVRSGRGTGW